MRPRILHLMAATALLAAGGLALGGCGGSSDSVASSSTVPSSVTDAVAALNDPGSGLSSEWARSGGGGGTAADLAAPSVILAPGYTCELVVTDTGVSLFLQEPGDRLPNQFDWTPAGGVVSQPTVPASAPTGGIPCTLSDSWQVAVQ